jgi:uncharacterized protein (DUF305 family)
LRSGAVINMFVCRHPIHFVFQEPSMKTLTPAGLALAFPLLALSLPALAQHHGSHGQQAPAATVTPSTKAFEAANERMHKDMAIKFSGNADIDFFKGMIPHHQGAIDMAKVVLEHGKNPETKKMAQEIIAAQEKEIAFMREWLKKQGQ